MDDNTSIVIVIFLIFVFLGFSGCFDSLTPKNTDPLAARIQAVEDATFGMSDESKERIMIEVLRGNTNSPQVILERPQ